MKKVFLFGAIAACVLMVSSCEKDESVINQQSSDQSQTVAATSKLKAATAMTEYLVSPKFGKPNSTNYYFQVYDLSGSSALSVKLYEKATGLTTYLPMTRVGNNWVLSTTISANGWYDWRYVYSSTKTNISSNVYTLCNTKNTFSSNSTSTVMSSPCYITWPFGADGSSWFNRTVYISGIAQLWKGGSEGGSGNGPGQGYHVGTTERFADDWNRGTGSQDFGAELRSPLDGTVLDYGTYSTSLGTSKFVAVQQIASDGRVYKFFFGHMNAIDPGISLGKYVKAGVTKLGTLGMTGTDSPHAHCSLRDVTSGEVSAQFAFSAQ